MKTIWKLELVTYNPCIAQLPGGAKIVCVREQYDGICMWALVDTDNPLELRTFHVYGTGHAMPEKALEYVGTAHLSGGSLVFHVFEEV